MRHSSVSARTSLPKARNPLFSNNQATAMILANRIRIPKKEPKYNNA